MGGCYNNNIFSRRDVECTRELVAEVAKQLAMRTKRDTDFPVALDLDDNDLVAIVQSGENRKVSLGSIAASLDVWLGIDKIREKLDNISVSVRYGDTAYWNNQIGYVPEEGEIIIYSDYQQIEIGGQTVDIPGIKIGSGNAYVQDLVFTDQYQSSMLLSHINNEDVHTSVTEKAFWNHKLNVVDNAEVVDNVLVFNRN